MIYAFDTYYYDDYANTVCLAFQDMEINHLIKRTVLDTKPVTVEYEITEYGKTIEPIIDEIAKWGIEYRKSLYQKTDK